MPEVIITHAMVAAGIEVMRQAGYQLPPDAIVVRRILEAALHVERNATRPIHVGQFGMRVNIDRLLDNKPR